MRAALQETPAGAAGLPALLLSEHWLSAGASAGDPPLNCASAPAAHGRTWGSIATDCESYYMCSCSAGGPLERGDCRLAARGPCRLATSYQDSLSQLQSLLCQLQLPPVSPRLPLLLLLGQAQARVVDGA